ncbi:MULTISPECIES: acyltransferase [unclassified Cryobacterium]|uniref:acyltransferase family protein n=1 Tax=unclassified Cryobacterium TaxID=2649013 RepID=UPI002AB368B6|nr:MULTISPECIES: acyltransferase [unclassified Cryobacterium]MDY7542576.1 acyltransferase [Cryobacterium sp. 5B3]MEB0264696.1 acyltransferase [Cryobacterium sp. 10I5]MEB0273668.1 acyltransferase [Cryobacterium sp. 5B3]
MPRLPSSGRLVALDALRGVAAGIVLVHHVSMTAPGIAAAYQSTVGVNTGSAGWWSTLTPLKFLVAGPEFVLVFFVLSGFVLVRSPLASRAARTAASTANGLSSRGYDWVAYYPRRIIRLAIPVVVSVALAAAWILLVPRTGIDVGGSWLKRQDSPDIGLPNLLGEASVIGGSGRPDVNPPLWSLTWEMWFSLLLPICVLLAVATRRLPALWAAAFLAVSATGYVTGIEPLMYLPAFGLGALLAANYESLSIWAARVAARRGGTAVWIGLTALGPALLVSHWLLRPQLSGLWGDLTLALRVPGAVLVVAVVALWPPLQRPLSARPLVWLGTVSFSLYLVHFPVVVAFGTMFGPGRWWLGALVSVPLSLVLAQLMYLWVELPAQRLATWTGRWASEKAGALRGHGGRQADAAASAALAARAPENDRVLAE